MKFDKGSSGNPNGRPRGAKNRSTENLRHWITAFIEKNTSQIEKDWKSLTPKERLIMFERLLKFSLPTLQSVSNKVDFSQMSDEDLNKIIEELKNSAA